MAATQQARGRRPAGFTLIELMIAAVLASIVIIATFSFMTSMSGLFFSQDMIVDAQSNVRSGLTFMSQDVRRAGYLASPAAAVDPLVCPKPVLGVPDIRAIHVDNGGDADQVFGAGAPENNNNIEPDRLTLMGSFDSADLFQLDGLTGQSARINAVSAARALGNGTPAENQAVFENLFIPGRAVRVSDIDGSAQFGVITSASFNNGAPTVNIQGLVVRAGNLGCGLEGVSAQSFDLSVINIIAYHIQRDVGDDTKTNLMRTELDARNGEPLRLPGNQPNSVIVVEYAVDMQVLAYGDRAGGLTPRLADDEQGDDVGSLDYNFLDNVTPRLARWNRIRALELQLSVRTPREDPNLFHFPRQRGNGQRGGRVYGAMTSYNLDPDPNNSAHVVTMTTMIETPNLTYANVR